MSVARAMAAALPLLLLAPAAGCGKRTPAAAKDAAPVAAVVDAGVAASLDARAVAQPAVTPPARAAPFWADRPEPALRALGAALQTLEVGEARDWLERRKLPVPEGEAPVPPPAAVQAAIDALVAWDGSGALAPVPCTSGLDNPMPYRLLTLLKAAIEAASGPADAPAHAALRMALVLRVDDNDPLAMNIGAAITKDARESFERRGLAAAIPATFAVADDLPWRVLASNARCAVGMLASLDRSSPEAKELMDGFAKMGRDPARALDEEAAAVKAFWDETLAQAAGARTRAELRDVLERRTDDAHDSRPRSMLVPVLGPPHAASMLVDDDE
jgi:hypothetical protein